MDCQKYNTQVEVDSYERQTQLIEKGRQLHNQAIQQMFILAARGLKHTFKKAFGGSSEDRAFDCLYREIPAKK